MRIPDYTDSQFSGLNTFIKDLKTLKPGVATDSLNWVTGKYGDHIELRRGSALLGNTRVDGAGKIYAHALDAMGGSEQALRGVFAANALPLAPTATRVFVNSTDTLVVATSTGRVALELSNASGATTSPQTVYCNYGDRPAVLYSGVALFASTTKAYLLDNLYRGAIRCIAPANGALITVTDF